MIIRLFVFCTNFVIMIIVFSKYLVPKGFIGITFYPFIILKNKNFRFNKILVNHERIHLRQQLDLFILFFYVWYTIEFVVRFCICKNKKMAYKSISFEKEAYVNEHNLKYLDKRKWMSFLKYLK